MASKRLPRLNEQLKRELAELIQTELRDPRVGFVSVTAVHTAADLGSARVFVRVLGNEAEKAESMEGLVAAAPYLRKLLGQLLEIRRIPEIRFEEDRTLEQALRIEHILAEVLPAEAPDIEGSLDEATQGNGKDDEEPEDLA